MAPPNVSPEQIMKRAFLRIADVLYGHWEEGTGPHSRLFDIRLNHINKEQFIVGDSEAAAKSKSGPEHLMPCAEIVQRCLKLFEQGKVEGRSAEDVKSEVAQYMEKNLKIVRITQEERKLLDSLPGLKAKMPGEWKEGDDISERLKRANIPWKPRMNLQNQK
jgi:hypothetical protein